MKLSTPVSSQLFPAPQKQKLYIQYFLSFAKKKTEKKRNQTIQLHRQQQRMVRYLKLQKIKMKHTQRKQKKKYIETFQVQNAARHKLE